MQEAITMDFNSILAMAFGLWAAVVGFIGRGILKRLDTISQDLKQESARLQEYIVQTETRLGVIEHQLDINHG